ncbi:apolipoprotein N-acyltransferase [Puia sp.]|uniref:apolipoprotein N-acyltransferase n=1 Tax=Puia sp. TaxID=2045100 RepID=UPI002F3F6406
MKKFHPLLLSVLSGILLFAAWPVSPFTFLVFVAFIPLLWLERQGSRRYFGWVYLAMLTWNLAATWWVWNASEPGSIAAFLANSLLMCLPWLGFRAVRRRMGDTIGYSSLVVFWLSFEYLHLQNWGLSWPWLTLGNVFATRTAWIQWYEYTGTSGGGLWVLVVNVLLFLLAWDWVQKKKLVRQRIFWVAGLLAVPILVSLILTPHEPDHKAPAGNIVIIQPNIDPYEKLSTGSFDAQLQKLLRLSESAVDSNTTLLVWPETALYNDNGFLEDRLKQSYFLNPLWDFLRRHPRIDLLTGIESVRLFKEKHSPTAFLLSDTNEYLESYNAAVLMDSSGPLDFYHKSRLVPGAESLPPFLHVLDAWFEKFGGTTSGYTGQDERTVFETPNHLYRIAPIVCFESIYGEFISKYVHNGANILAIITNDGWWRDTPGYKQHESYARMRAIETRRWVIRSANTGVSCIIDPVGKIIESRPWNEAAFIKTSVPTENTQTFYVRYGDCLSKLMLALALIFVIWNIVTFIKTRMSRG